MKVRLWLIEHRLTAAEEQRVRENRRNRNSDLGQVKITYRKKRVVKDVEADGMEQFQNIMLDCEQMEGLEGVFRKFTTVFAAAPAEDGEKCSQIENAWSATEVELPLE